jgi:hypothetical protein
MNVNPGNTAGPLAGDQDAAPPVMDEGKQVSDNPSFVSKAPAENMVGGQITEGVPVMDVHGETIGNVGAYDEQAGTLVVRGGWFFDQDTQIPINAIGDRGASGIYLTQPKDELMQQYGSGATSGMTGQATGNMDRSSTAGSATGTSMAGTMAMDTDAATMGANETSGATMSRSTSMESDASATQIVRDDTAGTMGDDRVIVRDDSTQGVLRDMGTAMDSQDT